MLEAHFDAAMAAPAGELPALPSVLAPPGIVGRAAYDALVGLATRAANIPLVTRDARALGTYTAVRAEAEAEIVSA